MCYAILAENELPEATNLQIFAAKYYINVRKHKQSIQNTKVIPEFMSSLLSCIKQFQEQPECNSDGSIM